MANISPLALALGRNPPPSLDPDVYEGVQELYTQFGVMIKQYNMRHGVLQSPNGHYWRISVSNTGVLTATDIGTVLS